MYLSSFRLGAHPERFVEMVDAPRRAALMANATDVYPEADRRAGVVRELKELREIGLEPTELDLRSYLDDRAGLARDLAPYQALWVRGGNTFFLRYLYARTGLDAIVSELLSRDAIVYAGYSAGICLLGPSLRGLELTDEPEKVRELYGAEPIWEGLGLVPYAIVPHVDSAPHPETEACGRLAEHYRRQGITHRILKDGQAIVIDGASDTII